MTSSHVAATGQMLKAEQIDLVLPVTTPKSYELLLGVVLGLRLYSIEKIFEIRPL